MSKVPRHPLSLRPRHDLDRHHQLDFWLKYKSATRFEATETPVAIPGRVDLDVRYALRLNRSIEVSIVGQNLPHSRALQYVPDQLPSSPVEIWRGIHLRAEFRY